MAFARWMSNDELKNVLVKVTKDSEITSSGIPFTYDDNSLYINDKEEHTLVVGSTGSGKTQTIILPLMKLALKANEQVLVNDPLGELYNETASLYRGNGYEIISINYNDLSKCNNYNPLHLAFKLYKEGNKDESCDLLNDVAYYLFYDNNETSSDPFWINSAKDYFIGLGLYLFDQEQEEVTLSKIFTLSNEFTKDNLNNLDKDSKVYIYLNNIVNAPVDTKGGIISVFSQKLRYLISRESLNNATKTSDYDLRDLINKKHIIYLIGNDKPFSKHLLTNFINEYIYCNLKYGNNKIRKNILLDELDTLIPIPNLPMLITRARSNKMRFTMMVRGFNDLENSYGKEMSYALRLNVGSIIYLLSTNPNTLDEISNMCGKASENNKLITSEELKVLNIFEAVILKVRCMPIKTKLIPDYEIPWDFTN